MLKINWNIIYCVCINFIANKWNLGLYLGDVKFDIGVFDVFDWEKQVPWQKQVFDAKNPNQYVRDVWVWKLLIQDYSLISQGPMS